MEAECVALQNCSQHGDDCEVTVWFEHKCEMVSLDEGTKLIGVLAIAMIRRARTPRTSAGIVAPRAARCRPHSVPSRGWNAKLRRSRLVSGILILVLLSPRMTSDPDIYRAAQPLIDRQGENTLLTAAFEL